MRIVFFGTPSFAAHILEYLLDSGHEIVGVVTRPDKPKGRSKKLQPSEVKSLIQEKAPLIPIFQPEKASTDSFERELKSLSPDVFVVAAYGEIMKTNILDLPKKMCINVHPSLLPKYRGATPIQTALLNGDHETGVTIMEMVLKMDAGDILGVARAPVPEDITFGELEEILWKLSNPVLEKVLAEIEGDKVVKIPQDPEKVTFSKKVLPEDRIIDWKKSAGEIHNQIRAFSPRPGAYCMVEIGGEKKRLTIRKAQKVAGFEAGKWVVSCGEGFLSLLEVQLEGKKSLSIEEFLRGQSEVPQIKS